MRGMAFILSASLLSFSAAAQGVYEPAIPEDAILLDTLEVDESLAVENALVDIVSRINDGFYSVARYDLDSLSKICPDNDAVRYYQGVTHMALRDFTGAVECLEKAVALDSTNIWYMETLAEAYSSKGDGAGVGRTYLKLSRTNPRLFKNAYTLMVIADSYRIQGDMNGYFSCLTDFVRDPDLSAGKKSEYLTEMLGNLSSKHFKALLPRMDTLMRSFVEAEPSARESHALLMEIASYRKDWPTVIEECYAQISLYGQDTSKVVSLMGYAGDCFYQIGSSKEAYKVYEQTLRINPDYCPVLNNYAYFLSEQRKHLSKAAKMSRRTIELEPDNPTYLDTYGWILYLQKKYREAKPLFKHAMLYGGKDNDVVLMHYSMVLSALGEDDLAAYYKGLSEAKAKKQ